LRGRVREGGSFTRGVDDDLQDASAISQHIGVPKSKHPISLRGQPPIALDISLGVGVLAAIDLDDKSALVTGKVDDVRSDWRLSAKA
jgi:hypothetical protein